MIRKVRLQSPFTQRLDAYLFSNVEIQALTLKSAHSDFWGARPPRPLFHLRCLLMLIGGFNPQILYHKKVAPQDKVC